MPLGYERINERQRRPNDNIVFTKPLEGADKATSQDFLERIAAICVPIMRANHLYVAALEEFPPNKEFWGRNFNAGEVIQLVLKSPTNGRWLPFRFVQMVMMHELAHCKQMNHGREFWKVRNAYAGELRELWSKNYTGDGFWGKGQKLYDGQYSQDSMPAEDESPQHLCGGVYRSGRRGKRGRKAGSDTPQLSYAEKKQRRIEKKFGKNGMALGGDDDERVKLENGKKPKGKPRVAGSVRGRELRAAAALARFGQSSMEASPSEEIKDEGSETEDDDEYEEPAIKIEAVDDHGHKILDGKGKPLIRVCEDEDPEFDMGARQELEELGTFALSRPSNKQTMTARKQGNPKPDLLHIKEEDESTASELDEEDDLEVQSVGPATTPNGSKGCLNASKKDSKQKAVASSVSPASAPPLESDTAATRQPPTLGIASTPEAASSAQTGVCWICSLENGADALTCAACGHVLDVSKILNSWECHSVNCKQLGYVNVGDNGICGLCGSARRTA